MRMSPGRCPSLGLRGEGHREGPLKLLTLCRFVFEAGSHVVQASLKLVIRPKIAISDLPTSFCFSSAGLLTCVAAPGLISVPLCLTHLCSCLVQLSTTGAQNKCYLLAIPLVPDQLEPVILVTRPRALGWEMWDEGTWHSPSLCPCLLYVLTR